jgi:hypothetical protein
MLYSFFGTFWFPLFYSLSSLYSQPNLVHFARLSLDGSIQAEDCHAYTAVIGTSETDFYLVLQIAMSQKKQLLSE